MQTLGIDSSNYRSSAAVYFEDGTFCSYRKLLPVALGERGLRQSDAVFAHVKQLPQIVADALNKSDSNSLKAVGVSDRPRRLKDSYMPCFLVGVGLAETVASALNIPLYRFSHQEGHIAAALLSANATHLIGHEFIAFHVSGGTTEALLVRPAEIGFETEIIGKTLDLNLGQVIDRVGVMLGLSFPSGPELEKLAEETKPKQSIRPCIKGTDCALSGVENQCANMLDKGCSKKEIAAYTIHMGAEVLARMTEAVKEKYGSLPIVYSGGVMANSIIKRRLSKVADNVFFASLELSGDNAVGIAYLANLMLEKDKWNRSV